MDIKMDMVTGRTTLGGINVEMNGRIGIDGRSAYEIAVENGYEGTAGQWINSLGQPALDAAAVARNAANVAEVAVREVKEVYEDWKIIEKGIDLAVEECGVASRKATDAAGRADTAREKAELATIDCKEAAAGATDTIKDCQEATSAANFSAATAEEAATEAKKAVTKANSANDLAMEVYSDWKEIERDINLIVEECGNASRKADEVSVKTDTAREKAELATIECKEASARAEDTVGICILAAKEATDAGNLAEKAATAATNASTLANTATEQAKEVYTDWKELEKDIDLAVEECDSASRKADEAASKADTAREKSELATIDCKEAATKAEDTVEICVSAANQAMDAAGEAGTATNSAKEAAARADSAAEQAKEVYTDWKELEKDIELAVEECGNISRKAEEAITKADKARENAELATIDCKEATAGVEDSIDACGTAASQALDAADKADTSAASAISAATRADTAAGQATEVYSDWKELEWEIEQNVAEFRSGAAEAASTAQQARDVLNGIGGVLDAKADLDANGYVPVSQLDPIGIRTGGTFMKGAVLRTRNQVSFPAGFTVEVLVTIPEDTVLTADDVIFYTYEHLDVQPGFMLIYEVRDREFGFDASGTYYFIGTAMPGHTYHIVFVCDKAAATGSFYLNGCLMSTQSVNFTMASNFMEMRGMPSVVHRFRLFGSAVDTSLVRDMWNDGAPQDYSLPDDYRTGQPAGCQLEYLASGMNSDNWKDLSGNGNDMVLVKGTPSLSSRRPAFPRVVTGTVVPTEPPLFSGQMYINTSAGKIYTGTEFGSKNNWLALN